MAEKTKAELEADNAELRAQLDELLAASPAPKISLLSKNPLPRNRGGYTIPGNNDEPIVLDLSKVAPRDLKAIMDDPYVIKVRTDSPLSTNVVTFEQE